MLAFFVDKGIICAISLVICEAAILSIGISVDVKEFILSAPEEIPTKIGAFTLLCALLFFLADVIYFTVFHGINGQTPGKMLLRLQVRTLSGDRITTGTAFLRWVGYLISGLFFALGFLWVAFDRKKQGWHDKIAMTVVICMHKEPAAITKVPESASGGETDETEGYTKTA